MTDSRFSSFQLCGKVTLAVSIAAVLSACAADPKNIKATANSDPCTQADRARLAAISEEQAKTARNDKVGVLLIGVPVGSMGRPDHSDEIARLKGSCGS